MLNEYNNKNKLLDELYRRLQALFINKKVHHHNEHGKYYITTDVKQTKKKRQRHFQRNIHWIKRKIIKRNRLPKNERKKTQQNQSEEQRNNSTIKMKSSHFMTDDEKSQCMSDIDIRINAIQKRIALKTALFASNSNASAATSTIPPSSIITPSADLTAMELHENENDDHEIDKPKRHSNNIGEKVIKLIWRAEELIDCINEYLHMYAQLVERDELVIIGSKLYTKNKLPPCHAIPTTIMEKEWLLLSKEEQLIKVEQIAKQTREPMKLLLQEIEQMLPNHILLSSIGPMKQRQRIIEKRDNDYTGNILRVVDFIRCSIVLLSLQDCQDLVDWFVQQQNEYTSLWKLIRIKDGFETVDNYITGGYRDIKVNLLYIPNGHIIEIQLHIKEFYDLKVNGGGHIHYEFARKLNINGVTDPLQLINHNDIPYIINLTNEKYDEMNQKLQKDHTILGALVKNHDEYNISQDLFSLFKLTLTRLRRLANLFKTIKEWTKSIELFKQALRLCNEGHPIISHFDGDTQKLINLVSAEAKICISSCYYELWIDDIRNQNSNNSTFSYSNDPLKLHSSIVFQQQPQGTKTTNEIKSFLKSHIYSGIDYATEYFQKEFGTKHPYTLNSQRTRIDVASISSRYQYNQSCNDDNNNNNINKNHNIDNIYNERKRIDQLYQKLLLNQKEVLGYTHPELLVTCHRYGTYMCDSSLPCFNKKASNDDDDEDEDDEDDKNNKNNSIIIFRDINKEEEVKRYKDGVQLLINGLNRSLPRLGTQNTIFQKYLVSAHNKAIVCNDPSLIQQCTELMQ